MKIGIVTDKMQATGGVQVFTRDISRILKEGGHDVDVVSQESLGEIPKKDTEKAVGNYFNQVNRDKNYDVVLCNGEYGYSVNHPRAINVFHGNYYGYAMSVKGLVEPSVTNERLKKVDLQRESAKGKYVVAVSNFASQGLEDSGIKVNQIIKNSVDPDKFYPIDMHIMDHAIAVARGMYYEKGFDTILKLAEKGVKIKLFSDTKLDSSNINNCGFVENGKLNKEYNQAQMLIFPSRFEGGSLTTLEALACGCPLITRAVGYGSDLKKAIPNFVANSIGQFLAKYVILLNEREKYSKEAIDYFWANHNPETFKKEWVSLVEGI